MSSKISTLGLLGFLIAIATAASATPLRTVALSGQSAPGAPAGVSFSSFSTPALNSSGLTAFGATLGGIGVATSNDRGVWSEGSGPLSLILREGMHAPGIAGDATFSNYSRGPIVNSAGQTAFIGSYVGSALPANNTGFWTEGNGQFEFVTRSDMPAPGFPSGSTFSGYNITPILNAAGQMSFVSLVNVSTGGSRQTIWVGGAGSLSLVAQSGVPAPGAPDGVLFGTFPISSAVLNPAGWTAFAAPLTLGGVGQGGGIWTNRNGMLEMLTRTGLAAPGTLPGVNFASFEQTEPVLNAQGQIAFASTLEGGVTAADNSGIWAERNGGLTLVAREGSAAPGTTPDVQFATFGDPVINAAGRTAFWGTLTGGTTTGDNDSGMWSEDGGALAMIARAGDQAPGTPAGVTFGAFDFFSIHDPVLNSRGQTAFLGPLTGSGVSSANNSGIWAQDVFGVLHLIAREGDPLELSPGDSRTISLLEFVGGSGNEDGRRSGFNDRGQVAFHATFTDGSAGIFVSDLVAVPEPSSLILACMTALGYRRPRRGSLACSGLGLAS